MDQKPTDNYTGLLQSSTFSDMEHPLISVIIPIFNRANVIKRSINSVLNQSYQQLEIILWDDGSTDDIARKVGEIQDERLHFYSEANHGASYARNRAIEQAKGEWIAFLDSDDEWLPDKLAEQVACLERDPSLDMIFTNSIRRSIEKKEVRTFDLYKEGMSMLEKKPLPACGNIITGGLLENVFKFSITLSTVLIRRTILEETGGFDEGLRNGEDRELWWRVALTGAKIAFINDPLIIKHQTEKSLGSYSKIFLENQLKCIDVMISDAVNSQRPDLIQMLKVNQEPRVLKLIRIYQSEGDHRKALALINQKLRLGKRSSPMLRSLAQMVKAIVFGSKTG